MKIGPAIVKSSMEFSPPRLSAPRVKTESKLEEPQVPIEALLSPEVLTEVREALARDWFITERDDYRQQLEYIWCLHHEWHTQPRDAMLMLDNITQKGSRTKRIPYINQWREYLFYNKATVFYWMDSAHHPSHLSGLLLMWEKDSPKRSPVCYECTNRFSPKFEGHWKTIAKLEQELEWTNPGRTQDTPD